MWFGKELLILGLACLLGKCQGNCGIGLSKEGKKCVDTNECEENPSLCGNHSRCFNTYGSYYCQCITGFINERGGFNFTASDGQCQDINECRVNRNICGSWAHCTNRIGGYDCTCNLGYVSISNGQCKEVDCDRFSADSSSAKTFAGLADILSMMRNSCLALSNPSLPAEGKVDGEAQLEKLFTATEKILEPGSFGTVNIGEDVSGLLSTVENSVRFIGPLLKDNRTKLATTETDAEIAVQRGESPPTGPLVLAGEHARLDTDWSTAAGTGAYPGFALAALVSYKNLHSSLNGFFKSLKGYEKDGVDPSFQVSSRVVSIVVSNPSTQSLSRPVNITLRHLESQEINESVEVSYICAYWNEGGFWATDGCHEDISNATHTSCLCKHLSSFAVLMALYPMEPNFGLQLVTKIGLTLSLLCLIVCILTFKFCRSIQGTRTTIHLHLCICLFMADLIFLVGISQTKPEGGCRLVAGLLHFFFLGMFTWMLLEGVQLYRMVVLVFNATIRPLYLYVTGYGIPLIVVILSASIRPKGYGTELYCWLSLQDGLIWSFFGPVCIIILLNVVFFIVTVWKLAQKFTSLNPDLSKLHKIRAFTVTAVAQMCILGLMWVFGAFLFQKDAIVVPYIFTILNSLQGALVFIMHCLLSKQVRDEYAHFLSCICTPEKKRYSDFSSTNPSSSQSRGSRSGQLTGESQI
ncbi:CD97 antigen isoform X1 [Salarias fasciatus]|uniref:CD97 antigen isoform X1 n=1 Tax=Salarias fasciatus TaxID=181472 RepID=UPI0011769ED5|nr:CD97 antigen-like isoform X1 [Salarias fasciatus]